MTSQCQNCTQKPLETSGIWFWGPVGITISVIYGVLSAILWLLEPGLKNISSLLWPVLSLVWLFLTGMTLVAFLFFFFAPKQIPLFTKLAWKILAGLFFISLEWGPLVGLSSDRIQQAAIHSANSLFLKQNIKLPADKILILIPHCIQKDTCGLKVTVDSQNCKRCGQCQVGELADIARDYGVHLAIVPGGTLARKRIMEIRPKAVLAIACERDLTSGIRDAFPVPVFGVLNSRPFGPCVNTQVDMNLVKQALNQLLIKEKID